MPLLIRAMAPEFALFTKGSKLPLNMGFKNMFVLLQSCAQPSKYPSEKGPNLKGKFICVEVLLPSQPNGVISSIIS